MPEKPHKAPIKNTAFWVCLTLTIGLLITGFFMPPRAKIDGSVLTACGILFAFATLETANVAMKRGTDAKVKHGTTELLIGDLDEKDQDYEPETEE